MINVTIIIQEGSKMAQLNKDALKGVVIYLKDYRKEVPKKISKSISSVFDCTSREDKIIRNVWLFFVIGVFAFSSILWKFQGSIFSDDFHTNDEMMVGYW
jgi:hypothetical protein